MTRPPSSPQAPSQAPLQAPSRARRCERGVASAEYAVATAAGCGFAALLIELLTGGFGEQLLTTLFELITGLIGL